MPNTKTEETKKIKTVKTAEKTAGLDIALFGIDGAKKGTIALSKEIFGAKINEPLMLQALRVYMVNQRQGSANTKTRGEVRGSTRKIYRQKGTGRARHGANTAPIFVGGGIAMGPRSRDFELKMSKQMRRKALFSALSQKLSEEKVLAVDGAQFSGKTKEAALLFKKITDLKKNKVNKILFVTNDENAKKASKNIDGLTVLPAQTVNIYEVVNSNYLVIAKDAVKNMEDTFLVKEASN